MPPSSILALSSISYYSMEENKTAKAKGRRKLVIAIDGPAASGKSTVGEILAQRLGYVYYDTGALYRAVTWAALHKGLNPQDERAITRLAAESFCPLISRPTAEDGRQYSVFLEGRDITWELRAPQVERW